MCRVDPSPALRVDVLERDGCAHYAGPLCACLWGCCRFWCLCRGCVAFYCKEGKKESDEDGMAPAAEDEIWLNKMEVKM